MTANHERTLVCAGVMHRVPVRRLSRAKSPHPVLDLHGADLRGRDLRSLDLDGADLRDADLRRARTGLSVAWRVRLAMLSLAISVSAGVLSGLAGQRLMTAMGSASKLERTIGLVICAELGLFLLIALWKGLNFAVRHVLAPVGVLALLLSVFGTLAGGTGAAGGTILAFSLLIFALITLATLWHAVAHNSGILLLIVVAVSGSVAERAFDGGLFSTALAVAAFLLARRTLSEDPGLPYLTRITRRIASAGGTSLRNADLRGAQLANCHLTCTDLRGARLEGADLSGASEFMCSIDPAQQKLLPFAERTSRPI